MYLFGDKGKPEVHQKSACTKKEVIHALRPLGYAPVQGFLAFMNGQVQAGSSRDTVRTVIA